MNSERLRSRTRFALFAIGLTACLTATAAAQTTPTSAFRVSTQPQLAYEVWPGDFNGDGRTDLIAGAGRDSTGIPTNLVLTIGKGDGTFNTPKVLGIAAEPMTVADFNGDGRADVVLRTATGVSILPGNGNGTFASPRVVNTQRPDPPFSFAIGADFDGDGTRDLVVSGRGSNGTAVFVYHGFGDFTFGAPVELPSSLPVSAISGDFNGDGRRDLAVAEVCCSLEIFINNGGLLFSPSEIPMAADMGDITTGDLNRDGRLDLVVAEWSPDVRSSAPGAVGVLLGRGDGTFAPKVDYDPGVPHADTVVVGDLTRDGILDVATGNQSTVHRDDYRPQYWDSISVLRGNGDGTLTPAVTYALGNVTGAGYIDAVSQLNTSDLNGDGRTDLIASPGIVLVNVAPVPNRSPTAFAGPDYTVTTDDSILLDGRASDPDGHWLYYEWSDETGRVIATTPQYAPFGFITGGSPGPHTFTLTVHDQFGGTASDSITVTVGPSYIRDLEIGPPFYNARLTVDVPFEIRWSFFPDASFTRFDVAYSVDAGRTFQAVPGCTALPRSVTRCTWQHPGPATGDAFIRVVGTYADGSQWTALSPVFDIVGGPSTSLPEPWLHQDVGTVLAAGNVTFDGAAFTVSGSGADVWGTADEFHWAYRSMAGDFDMVAHVSNIQNINPWTKAGLMVRTSSAADSRYLFLLTTPGSAKGFALQGRASDGGAAVQLQQGGSGGPAWLKIGRRGTTIYAAYRRDTDPRWTMFGSAPVGNTTFVNVGLAVSSHVDGTLATATFDHVALDFPQAWSDIDVGAVGAAGSSTVTGPWSVTVRGSGADIWTSADAFHYRSVVWPGDGSITVRVNSIQNVNPWTKAGVMFRESMDPGSRYVMAIVSPSKGLAMQYRATLGGSSANVALRPGTAPQYIRLTRHDNTFTAATSPDLQTWTTLGSVTVPMSYAYVGLAVTSHDNRAVAAAEFEDVTLQH